MHMHGDDKLQIKLTISLHALMHFGLIAISDMVNALGIQLAKCMYLNHIATRKMLTLFLSHL